MAAKPQPAWGSLPFQQAIAFFQAKGLVPTERWSDLLGEAHDTGFMVAGIAKADLLLDLHGSVLQAMADGVPLQSWQADFNAICQKHGWEPQQGKDWRAKIILEHNIRTAYQAERYRQMSDPALAKAMPYWIYRHSDSSLVPRPLHVAWNGLVLPANDPWFRTHYPPNGWGCKCRVFAITRQELARMGRDGPDQAPDDGEREWTNPSTGNTVMVPNGIDPGWDYCPGATPMTERISQVVVDKIAKMPEPLAGEVKQDLLANKPQPLSLDEALKNGAKIRQELVDQYAGLEKEYVYQQEWRRLVEEKLQREVGAGSVALRTGELGIFEQAVNKAAAMMPASWIEASNAQGVVSADKVAAGRACYVWEGGNGLLHLDNPLREYEAPHELTHHLQRIMPGLDKLFQEFHLRRTQGDKLQSLLELTGDSRYLPYEMTRPDNYLSPYFGKDYNGVALEMLPKALGVVLGIDDTGDTVSLALRKDPAILDLALGVLFGYKP